MSKLKKLGWFLLGALTILAVEAVVAFIVLHGDDDEPAEESIDMAATSPFGEVTASQPAPPKKDVPAPPPHAPQPDDLNVTWSPGGYTLAADFLGKRIYYPRDAISGDFPDAGKPPNINLDRSTWPIVRLWARWSWPKSMWTEKYRDQALDVIMMRICDAERLNRAYPDIVQSAAFTERPEFLTPAWDPLLKNFAARMSGKHVTYKIRGKVGFLLPEYDIKTSVYVGRSRDGKTIYYHDRPEYITKYLKTREVVFVAHDAGDRILVDVKGIYLCSPGILSKDDTLKHMAKSSRYLVERMYHYHGDEAAKEVDAYLETVQQRRQSGKSPAK